MYEYTASRNLEFFRTESSVSQNESILKIRFRTSRKILYKSGDFKSFLVQRPSIVLTDLQLLCQNKDQERIDFPLVSYIRCVLSIKMKIYLKSFRFVLGYGKKCYSELKITVKIILTAQLVSNSLEIPCPSHDYAPVANILDFSSS